VTSSLLDPNIALGALFSNTLDLCSCLNTRDKFHTHTKNRCKCSGRLLTQILNISCCRGSVQEQQRNFSVVARSAFAVCINIVCVILELSTQCLNAHSSRAETPYRLLMTSLYHVMAIFSRSVASGLSETS
jgi:hypothetical protein